MDATITQSWKDFSLHSLWEKKASYSLTFGHRWPHHRTDLYNVFMQKTQKQKNKPTNEQTKQSRFWQEKEKKKRE